MGLTDSPNVLRHWMVGGPEVECAIDEYRESKEERDTDKDVSVVCHDDQTKSEQIRFKTQVTDMLKSMSDVRNPFVEESNDLLALHTKNIVAEEVVAKHYPSQRSRTI